MEYDLKIIKKKYGEKMSHLCRELFPTILEEEGLLSTTMLNNFNESHYLYNDIVKNKLEQKFRNYIYSLVGKEKPICVDVVETPAELLDKAGYYLFECKNKEDIEKFRKYYTEDELLCTFRGNRLNSCYVFFAVKKDVDKIKREDFTNPSRQDEYGTSVISIQIFKDDFHNLSIKNRYNHTVINSDATFSNNLDNIIEGLTNSFEKYYGLIQKNRSNNFEIPKYVRARDGKYYKYNYEINNIYYCYDNIIINDAREALKFDKSRYLLMDYFLIDLSSKRITLYDRLLQDSFGDTILNIDKINITNIKNGKKIEIVNKENKKINIEIDEYNRITKLSSDVIEEVGNNFLFMTKELKELNLYNLRHVGSNFLYKNKKIETLELPNLTKTGNNFLSENKILSKFIAPKLRNVGDRFLNYNTNLISLELPSLQIVKNYFMSYNNDLEKLEVPNLISVGQSFLENNKRLCYLNAFKLIEVGNNFLHANLDIKKLNLPNLITIGDKFLYNNVLLNELILPSVEIIGSEFMPCNNCLEEINLANLISIGDCFLYQNESLKKIVAPRLKKIGLHFLYFNKQLSIFIVPNLKKIGANFLKGHPNREVITKQIEERKNVANSEVKKRKLVRI